MRKQIFVVFATMTGLILPTNVFSAVATVGQNFPTVVAKPPITIGATSTPATVRTVVPPDEMEIILPETGGPNIVRDSGQGDTAVDSSISDKTKLDPQPEPPSPDNSPLINPAVAKGINPQPEPPKPTEMSVDELLNWVDNFAVVKNKATDEKIKAKDVGAEPMLVSTPISETQKKIESLKIKPNQIFSALRNDKEFKMETKVENNKMVYRIKSASSMPTLSALTELPVVVSDSQIEINGEQIVDYEVLSNKKEVEKARLIVGLRPVSGLEAVSTTIVLGDGSARIILPNVDNSTGEKTVLVEGQFRIDQDGMALISGANTYQLKAVPATFFKIARSLANGDEPKNITLKLVNEKPVYVTEVSEPIKLFGFIPMKMKTKITVPGDLDKIETVERPWYAVFSKVGPWKGGMELTPNLKVTNVKISAPVYLGGEKGKVSATLVNDGAGLAYGGFQILGWNPTLSLYAGGKLIQNYTVIIYLEPGESKVYEFNWDKIECGVELKVVLDVGDRVKEMSVEDNNGFGSTTCVALPELPQPSI